MKSMTTQVEHYGLCKRSFTTVFRRITCDRITVVYLRDRIRSNTIVYGKKTEQNGDYIRPPYTESVNDRFFSPYITVFLRI